MSRESHGCPTVRATPFQWLAQRAAVDSPLQTASAMRIDSKLSTALFVFLAACGGGGNGDPDAMVGTTPDAMPAPTGSIAGKVLNEHAGGSDALAGAVISVVGGPSTTTDATGDFLLEGVTPGDEVLVLVSGPRAGEPDHPLVYSSYRARVAVTAETVTEMVPVLMPGCERLFDAGAAATLDVTSCGGAGRAELVFPAGSLVRAADDSAFAGLVRAELAIHDPAAGAQALAFPGDTDALTDRQTFGAIEVRLYDALTGDALQVASGSTVEVAVEVAPTISSAPGHSVYLVDPATHTLEDEGPATIETRGDGRTYYRFGASHFSARIVLYYGGPIPNQSCIDYTVTPSGAAPPMVQMNSAGRWSIRGAAASGCVQSWPNASVRIRAIGRPGIQAPARVLSGWQTTVTGNPVAADSCDGSTPDCGQARLHIGSEGCIDGTFESQSWACQNGGSVPGTLYFSRDGRIFETRPAGNVCSAFFGTVMVPPGNGPVLIGDRSGSRYAWTPSFNPNQACTNLGTQSANGYGLFPSFVWVVRASVVAASRANDPGSAYHLDLDASASEGMIHTYAWDLYQVTDGSETLVWAATSPDATASVQVDAGRYRIRLRIYAGASLVAERSSLKDVPGPGASFVMNPNPPLVDQQVSFDASASTGNPVSYEWDFDNDGTFDATGVTTSHTYTAAGAVEIRLRVTDGNGAIDERVTATTVAADLPANTVRLTLTNAGEVRQNAGGVICTGPAVCQQTFTGNVLLETYNPDGTANQSAWGSFPNADGYQAFFNFAVQPSYDVTVTF